MNQFAGVQADEFAIFFLVIGHGGVGEALEAGAEAGFRAAGAVGDAAELALVAGEEADDEVGLAERVGLEDEGFARASGHGYDGVSDQRTRSRLERRKARASAIESVVVRVGVAPVALAAECELQGGAYLVQGGGSFLPNAIFLFALGLGAIAFTILFFQLQFVQVLQMPLERFTYCCFAAMSAAFNKFLSRTICIVVVIVWIYPQCTPHAIRGTWTTEDRRVSPAGPVWLRLWCGTTVGSREFR